MEPWAARLDECLSAAGKSPADLARACGIGNGSVSGWFGKGKPTKMISGDNLVAAAAFLGTTAEWIITGRGASQHARPDPETIANAMELLDELDAIAGKAKQLRPNPNRLAIALEVIKGGPIVEGRSVVVRLAERLRQWEENNGNDAGSGAGTGTTDGAAHGATQAARGKVAARRKG